MYHCMSEEVSEGIPDESLQKLMNLTENLPKFTEKTINIPGFGEIGIMELPKYVPLYVSATKTKAVRDLIPKEIHNAIMEFAYATGIEEKPIPRTKMADIPFPRSAIIQTILVMHDQGWGNSQIAKQTNMTLTTITSLLDEGLTDRNEGKLKLNLKRRFSEWIKRKLEAKVEAVFLQNAERAERLLPKQKEENPTEETKP